MSNPSVLNQNITGFFNHLLLISYPFEFGQNIKDNLFDEIITLNYNQYNETVYIETTKHYYVMELVKGLFVRVTEFDKPGGKQ